MFKKQKLLLVCLLAIAFVHNAIAQSAMDSTLLREYNTRIAAVEKSYNTIKTKIAEEFPKIDKQFFPLADSAFSFAKSDNFTPDKKVVYTNTLLRFINIIYDNATDAEMANGKLNDGFKYFILLAEWDSKNVLEQNIKLYRKFTLGYASLIPDDKICEQFIVNYARENPDEVLRNAWQFGKRNFAMQVIDSIVIAAPDLAKKYLTSDNEVSYNIVRSKSPVCKYILGVYRTYGLRSKAYLLAYNVLKNDFSMDAADSIGDDNLLLYKTLVKNMKQPDAFGKHSISLVLENFAIDQVRKVNDISQNQTGYAVSEYFKAYSSEELFSIMVYGYKELSLQGLTNLMSAIKRVIYTPYSYNFIVSIQPNKLKQFLGYIEKNERLDVILQVIDGKSLNYMYQLMSQPILPSLEPDFSISDSADIQALFKSRLPEAGLSVSVERTPKTTPDKDPVPQAVTKEVESVEIVSIPVKADTVSTLEAQVDIEETTVVPVSLRLSEREKNLLLLKKDLASSLKEIPKFINENYAEELLIYAAKQAPDEIFKRFDTYKSKFFAVKILEAAGKASPTSLKRYLYSSSHPIFLLLETSTDSIIKKIMKMPSQVSYPSKAYILTDAILKHKLTPSQADNICNSPQCMFKELVQIAKQKDYIGRYSVEHGLTDFSLRFLREINDNIALNEPEPFRIVENFTQEEIYFLMVFGREEVVTGSFNGLFSRLKTKMQSENFVQLLQDINDSHFRTFISMCASYNKLNEILAGLNEPQRDSLFVKFVHLTKDENNNDGAEIAETLNSIKDRDLLTVIHSRIKAEYLRAEQDSNNIVLALYSVLASLVDGHAVVENSWFNMLSKQIKLPAVALLPNKNLMEENQDCIEQMYFYNDVDGRESFVNFLNTFKVLPTWQTEDKGSYVIVRSVEGNKVEIYANKPEYESNGQDAIAEYFKANNLYPIVVIHRGHSFHTASTLQNVDERVKLLLVGSCGGFYKLSNAIDNAPDAHIIATKQIGTKTVNDPILLSLNELIRTGRNIVWKDFWEQMRQKIGSNPHFADYVPPHQNLKSLFSRAYFSLLGV